MAKKNNGLPGAVRALAEVANFGLYMGAGILIGYFLGSYLDRRFGSGPWLMLVFIVGFMVAAFVKFIQSAGAVDRKKNDR